ncbi:LXG domain-containing protein [Rossellomorea aquimaris]|uniref:LXG domain-containing protein n=1 Tax=Rossellomorea aquimaris TaxID=189382 RepID=UPI000698C785|nr:LXG domain-containing protein [Rossellomorea aquimaris]
MKMLDNASLHSGIEDLLNKLEAQKKQLDDLQRAVGNFTGLQESFSGKGGDAIRSFYQDMHVPFLTFYSLSLQNYERTLSNLKGASIELESDSNGLIHQGFLDGELTDGLNKSETVTRDLVDETNQTLNAITDIVHVPHIQDQRFLGDTKRAHHEITRTLEDLASFDADQTKALDTVDHDIQLMKRYIYDIQGMFKNGKISVSEYSGTELDQSFHRHPFMNTLEERLNEERLLLSKLTVSSEYDATRQLLMLGNHSPSSQSFSYSEDLSISSAGTAQTGYGVCYPEKDEFVIDKKVEDQFNSDGVGNAELLFKNDYAEGNVTFDLSGSVVDTKYMDDVPAFLEQKVLYGQMDTDIPYSFKSAGESLLYGQNIGFKTDAMVSKTTFSHDSSPLALDLAFGQADAKANIENYTASAGVGVSAAKTELKLEPLNFFGYEPLEEWFGFNYDPYIAVDLSLGSMGVSGSVGMETGVYAAYGIGIGLKGGLEEDKK